MRCSSLRRKHLLLMCVGCAVLSHARHAAAQTAAVPPPAACAESPLAGEYAANFAAARQALLDDTFQHRVRPALGGNDAAAGTTSVAPLQVVGGITDNGAVVKIRGGTTFGAYGLADVTVSVPDSAAKATKFDPLDLPHVFTIRPKVSWAPWKGVIPDQALRLQVCAQTLAFRQAKLAGPAPSAAEFVAFRSHQPESGGMIVDLQNAVVFGASYEFGHQAFEYAVHQDPTAPYSKTTETHELHAGSATAGIVLPLSVPGGGTGTRFFTALLTYQRMWGYTDAKVALLCAPLSLSTAAQCEQLAPGPPTRADKNSVQIDMRYWFEWPFAPGLRVTRDFRAGIDTFEAPIYFLQGNSASSFTGGLTVGYRDGGPEKGKFVAVFMGGTFTRPSAPKP